MKVQMQDGAVPFVVTYRKFKRKPKVKRTRRFVGFGQFVRNAIGMVASMIDDLAYTEETEVLDPGQSVAVHWAVQIEDPWNIEPGREASMVAYRMTGDRPPCAAHFEFITPPREEEMTPEEDAAQSANGNGAYTRPPNHAYASAPRRAPLVDENWTAPGEETVE